MIGALSMPPSAMARLLLGLACCWAQATGDGHPFEPTCFGSCGAAGSGGSTGGIWQSSSSTQIVASKHSVGDCSFRPCWLQKVSVAVSGSNTLGGSARAGVYSAAGTLLAKTDEVAVPTGLDGAIWLELLFSGQGLEYHASAASEGVWIAVHTSARARVIFDSAEPDDASRVSQRGYGQGLPGSQDWSAAGVRFWSSEPRRLRVQLVVGDFSTLPGSLPLILTAPHGGRMTRNWDQRSSGKQAGDTNTDLIAHSIWEDLGRRCNATPRAVIFHVHRQGVDANRATGTTVLVPGGAPCATSNNGECCCHIADAQAASVAMTLNEHYHDAIQAQVDAVGAGAILVDVHGMIRERIELGLALSAEQLNAGARAGTLEAYDYSFSMRALGSATELTWGNRSVGQFFIDADAHSEILPSPSILCADSSISGCELSTDASHYSGGYSTRSYVDSEVAGFQVELPPSMRNPVGTPPERTTKVVSAALAALLNEYVSPSPGCNADVNFGVACSADGTAVNGNCEVVGAGTIGVDDDATYQYGNGLVGKFYWTRFAATSETSVLDCAASSCQPHSIQVLIYQDDLTTDTYQMGVALYQDDGSLVDGCSAVSEVRSPTADRNWWLKVAFDESCSALTRQYSSSQGFYLAVWFTKDLKVRWVTGPDASEITRLISNGSPPPVQLPSWRDDDCSTLPYSHCRQWSGIYRGLMSQLLYTGGRRTDSLVSSASTTEGAGPTTNAADSEASTTQGASPTTNAADSGASTTQGAESATAWLSGARTTLGAESTTSAAFSLARTTHGVESTTNAVVTGAPTTWGAVSTRNAAFSVASTTQGVASTANAALPDASTSQGAASTTNAADSAASTTQGAESATTARLSGAHTTLGAESTTNALPEWLGGRTTQSVGSGTTTGARTTQGDATTTSAGVSGASTAQGAEPSTSAATGVATSPETNTATTTSARSTVQMWCSGNPVEFELGRTLASCPGGAGSGCTVKDGAWHNMGLGEDSPAKWTLNFTADIEDGARSGADFLWAGTTKIFKVKQLRQCAPGTGSHVFTVVATLRKATLYCDGCKIATKKQRDRSGFVAPAECGFTVGGRYRKKNLNPGNRKYCLTNKIQSSGVVVAVSDVALFAPPS